MLVQIAEIGAQVLEIGLMIEELHPLQHQRQIEHDQGNQRYQTEQEKEDAGSDDSTNNVKKAFEVLKDSDSASVKKENEQKADSEEKEKHKGPEKDAR